MTEKASLRGIEKNQEDLNKTEFREIFPSYFRFKELKHELKRSPDDLDFQKELREIGKDIFKNKGAFGHIKHIDPDISQEIQKLAQQKKMSLERELDRGGFSR